MDWDNFPSVYDPLARLEAYQKARDEERIRVEAALAKKPEERTDSIGDGSPTPNGVLR
jgi:hypothetical protein